MSLTFSLSFLLIPYIIFLAIFGFFAFFNVMQLMREGANEPRTMAILFLFFVGIVAILGATGIASSSVNWSAPVVLDFANSASTL